MPLPLSMAGFVNPILPGLLVLAHSMPQGRTCWTSVLSRLDARGPSKTRDPRLAQLPPFFCTIDFARMRAPSKCVVSCMLTVTGKPTGCIQTISMISIPIGSPYI